MSNFSIDGLATGLDTTNIIEQLVFVERGPIRRLEERRDGFSLDIAAWDAIETQFDELATALDGLTDGGLSETSVVTTPPEVSTTVTGVPTPGTHSFTVDQVAAAHQLLSPEFASPTSLTGAGSLTLGRGLSEIGVTSVDASALTDGSYSLSVDSIGLLTATVTFDGVTQDVAKSGTVSLTAGDGSTLQVDFGTIAVGTATFASTAADGTTTFEQLAARLNGAGGFASATVVDRQDGSANPAVMLITAQETGEVNAIETFRSGLSGMSGNFSELQSARDTIVSLGPGFSIQRPTAVVDGLVPGLTVDVGAVADGTDVNVTISRDEEGVTSNVSAFVDALNAVFSVVDAAGASNPDSGSVGPLSGDSSLRRLDSFLRGPLTTPANGAIVIAAQIGISVDISGQYTLDEEAFLSRLATDPDDVSEFLVGADGTSGLLGGLASIMDTLTDDTGLLTTGRTTAEANIEAINETLTAQERRLEQYEARIRAQFAAMETLIAQLNSQGSFLSGQLSGLNAG